MQALVTLLQSQARTSTTGMGAAGIVFLAAQIALGHLTMNPAIISGGALLAAAIALVLFPQATGAPPAAQAVATDLKQIVPLVLQIAQVLMPHALPNTALAGAPTAPAPAPLEADGAHRG